MAALGAKRLLKGLQYELADELVSHTCRNQRGEGKGERENKEKGRWHTVGGPSLLPSLSSS